MDGKKYASVDNRKRHAGNCIPSTFSKKIQTKASLIVVIEMIKFNGILRIHQQLQLTGS